MTARRNAAQHYRLAEDFAARAARLGGPDRQDADRLVALARIHLDLARHADRVLLGHDGRRDPEYLEYGEGWPPQHGDVWSDAEGQVWVMGRDRLTCLNDATDADPGDAHPELMRLAYRPYTPSAFDMEPPF